MITYYSQAWLDACQKNLNESESHQKKAKKLNGKFAFRVYDGPDGKDRYAAWEWENGKCTKVLFEAKPAPSKEIRESPFDDSFVVRLSCPFHMMAALNKGEMSPLKALSSPDYQVEGKKTLLFKMMQAINSWNEHNAMVACDYNFSKTDEAGNQI